MQEITRLVLKKLQDNIKKDDERRSSFDFALFDDGPVMTRRVIEGDMEQYRYEQARQAWLQDAVKPHDGAKGWT